MAEQDHPHEREWRGGELPEVDDAVFLEVLAETVRIVEGSGLPHAFMGGIASTALGRPRWTHDVDLLVRRDDARPLLERFAAAGFDTEEADQSWLYKAVKDGVLVDVIFSSEGGIELDDEMAARAQPGDFNGHRLTVLAPEDLVVIKALVHREYRGRHWFDALALVERGGLDWEYLVRRAAVEPARVASLLLYARSLRLDVPDEVVDALLEEDRRGRAPATEEPPEYLVARAKEALAGDPRTAELELDVAVEGELLVVTGTVATPDRQGAVAKVVGEALPGHPVRNLTTVGGDPEAAPVVERLP